MTPGWWIVLGTFYTVGVLVTIGCAVEDDSATHLDVAALGFLWPVALSVQLYRWIRRSETR